MTNEELLSNILSAIVSPDGSDRPVTFGKIIETLQDQNTSLLNGNSKIIEAVLTTLANSRLSLKLIMSLGMGLAIRGHLNGTDLMATLAQSVDLLTEDDRARVADEVDNLERGWGMLAGK